MRERRRVRVYRYPVFDRALAAHRRGDPVTEEMVGYAWGWSCPSCPARPVTRCETHADAIRGANDHATAHAASLSASLPVVRGYLPDLVEVFAELPPVTCLVEVLDAPLLGGISRLEAYWPPRGGYRPYRRECD